MRSLSLRALSGRCRRASESNSTIMATTTTRQATQIHFSEQIKHESKLKCAGCGLMKGVQIILGALAKANWSRKKKTVTLCTGCGYYHEVLESDIRGEWVRTLIASSTAVAAKEASWS